MNRYDYLKYKTIIINIIWKLKIQYRPWYREPVDFIMRTTEVVIDTSEKYFYDMKLIALSLFR